ncbi:MAG: hypothetical protein JWP97_1697 [Labilithrix sp.]|nr:hypothetical protein [Labilithrix sp.]
MISIRSLSTVSLLGLLVTLAGCSGEAASGTGADTTETVRAKETVADSTSADPARAQHRGHHPGGPDFLLVAALHEPTLNLTDAQKTTIQGALDASKPAAPPAFDRSKVSALAAGIRAGKVEATSIAAPAPSDQAARQAASAKALTTLHDTLTADQRKALVAAVSRHGDERKEHGPEEGRGPKGEGAGRPGPGGELGPMGHMLEGLDLTQAQKDTIKAKLDASRPAAPSEADRAAMQQQHEAMRAQMQTKLATFAGDTFDANAFVQPPPGANLGPAHADHFATELSIITSVLEPAQREKLAQKIEAGPQRR